MSIKIIYFVHGTTDDNSLGVCSGWNDAKLNEKGIERVKKLGELCKDIHMDVIFTSDLSRAVDTAAIAFPNVTKIADKRLRECNYGKLEGKSKELVNYEEHIKKRFPRGESLKSVEGRMRDFIEELENKYDGKTVGIVAHRATQLALDVIIKKMSWEEAISFDWRRTDNWQPGWEYMIEERMSRYDPDKLMFYFKIFMVSLAIAALLMRYSTWHIYNGDLEYANNSFLESMEFFLLSVPTVLFFYALYRYGGVQRSIKRFFIFMVKLFAFLFVFDCLLTVVLYFILNLLI